ncbi:PadR family transcriptional regulator [Streptococcus macacae]|uniref:Transcriptional regulator, PadR family n=1 Tax=Streptococcus macacae NCTC 11558 TaxID=764298 RepID=G5JX14_9STRE|nr:PadR family transcriptional regulator [Streptococcus macacae]EHJ51790.1 transcriptional regulator, PadR family [Streptococcus macacae NCTC 11558]SUN79493.1 putative transcriptional regulator, PadR family [Streptococcus macacae NCTC 11558]
MRSDDVVLGILFESSSTGYEIKQKFETVFRNFYNASFGSIYPILHKLEQQGKIESSVVHQDGKPDKKVYTITEKGTEAFHQYLQTEIEPRKNKWDFMVRMYFADNLSIQKQREMIDVELMRQEDSMEQLLELQKLIEKRVNQFQKFSLEIGLKQKEVLIEELKRLREKLK